MATRISIVVPTHNKRADAVRCVSEVLRQAADVGSCEVIVVDDGSRDSTDQALAAVDRKGIPFRYVRLEGNGPAVARNRGIECAVGELVVMVDDDAIPQPDWLRNLLIPFEDPGVVGVEGMVVPVGGEIWGPMGMSPSNLEGGVYLTCNCAYRLDRLLAVGGFDEAFRFPAFEDTDLAMQILQFGRIAWAPDAVVHHPRRRWSLRRSIRELRFNESLVRFALRYGCLGWTDRPTRFPRFRVLFASVVALPLGRVRSAFRHLSATPVEAVRFAAVSLTQGLFAAFLVPRCIVSAAGKPRERLSHLGAVKKGP